MTVQPLDILISPVCHLLKIFPAIKQKQCSVLHKVNIRRVFFFKAFFSVVCAQKNETSIRAVALIESLAISLDTDAHRID